jgi:hypothetical protein
VKDIQAVVFLKETAPGDYRVSLRSKGATDVGAIAKRARRRRAPERRGLCGASGSLEAVQATFLALAARRRGARRPAGMTAPDVHGVLVVDKPLGPTSHDVVARARRALGTPRVGHTGTLDPQATGVLPLVVGKATRLAQFLSASVKEYEALVAFGRATDTYDAAGATTEETGGSRRRTTCRVGARAVPRHVPAGAARVLGQEGGW